LEASRKVAIARILALPRAENGGIGEPGFTHDGHLR
jgi:hypothetical protein